MSENWAPRLTYTFKKEKHILSNDSHLICWLHWLLNLPSPCLWCWLISMLSYSNGNKLIIIQLSFTSAISFAFWKIRECLVCVFKQLFSVFKQNFTYFYIFFHLHVFSQIFSNNNFQFLNTYIKWAHKISLIVGMVEITILLLNSKLTVT